MRRGLATALTKKIKKEEAKKMINVDDPKYGKFAKHLKRSLDDNNTSPAGSLNRQQFVLLFKNKNKY